MARWVRAGVQVCLVDKCSAPHEVIESKLRLVLAQIPIIQDGQFRAFQSDAMLAGCIERVDLERATSCHATNVYGWNALFRIYLFSMQKAERFGMLSNRNTVLQCKGEEHAFEGCALPSAAARGLWEQLFFDHDAKQRLIEYTASAMLFVKHDVDPMVINWNRMVLLYGPPGTGKTSFVKAAAQKLSVRMRADYPRSYLLEVNAHSLFSKWFSESGKLVARMFGHILDVADDPDCLVFVLIDEVESLTSIRRAGGNEPSDALRVVNAMLTQLDNLKAYPNVLVLCTSNLTGALDDAFLDRADLKQYIGPPTRRTRYMILRSCVLELARTQILACTPDAFDATPTDTSPDPTKQLWALSELCDGMSGRRLRKVPLLAHAASEHPHSMMVPWSAFFESLLRILKEDQSDKSTADL
ncbi:Pachytene checkpoint protein 2-like [Porphyridium purpureum]|uniref:Pachytene checkpoint protein 2-like n=1 Tax=Porphyridium purpureum TaxID=35688 RepID=A0A5J4Z012_PORPP|nr:Pachytene checkpoint protein 2-like [Porphyridium purpureum]|eukprot:POR9419..scf208_2